MSDVQAVNVMLFECTRFFMILMDWHRLLTDRFAIPSACFGQLFCIETILFEI